MRVTLIAPLVARLRAAQQGGAQAVVADLARGLAERGQDVELVAPPGSVVPGVRLRPAPGGPFTADLLHMTTGSTAQPPAKAAPHAAVPPSPSSHAATRLR